MTHEVATQVAEFWSQVSDLTSFLLQIWNNYKITHRIHGIFFPRVRRFTYWESFGQMRGFGQFNYQVYIVGDDKELRHSPSLICPPFCHPNSQVSTPTLTISSLLD